MNTRFATIALSLALVSQALAAKECFGEQGGNIIIQAESTELSQGWRFSTAIPGYSGTGAIVWMDDNQYQFEGKGLLTYKVCATGGRYLIRGRGSRPNGKNLRGDEANDFFIEVAGTMTKLFASMGQTMREWKQFTFFDINHVKSDPIITLANGCQDFVVAGRSEYFYLDVIKLVKVGMDMMDSDNPMMVSCNGGGNGDDNNDDDEDDEMNGPEGRVKPMCSVEPSTDLARKIKYKVRNTLSKTVFAYKVTAGGNYVYLGRILAGSTKRFLTIRRNQKVIVAYRDGKCVKRGRAPRDNITETLIVN